MNKTEKIQRLRLLVKLGAVLLIASLASLSSVVLFNMKGFFAVLLAAFSLLSFSVGFYLLTWYNKKLMKTSKKDSFVSGIDKITDDAVNKWGAP